MNHTKRILDLPTTCIYTRDNSCLEHYNGDWCERGLIEFLNGESLSFFYGLICFYQYLCVILVITLTLQSQLLVLHVEDTNHFALSRLRTFIIRILPNNKLRDHVLVVEYTSKEPLEPCTGTVAFSKLRDHVLVVDCLFENNASCGFFWMGSYWAWLYIIGVLNSKYFAILF